MATVDRLRLELRVKDDKINVIFLSFLLQVTAENVAEGDEDSLLKCLVDIAESMPKFIRHCLPDVIDLCLKILKNSELENAHRHLALEVMVTLSETASAMIRKHPTYTHNLGKNYMVMMVQGCRCIKHVIWKFCISILKVVSKSGCCTV
jgi:hypothetical protein